MSILNATFIDLIPKPSKSEDPQGFRPIVLSNVIYKIIATMIFKCLKPLLPNLISPEQTGFVEWQQVIDGFVTSQEIVHSIKHHKLSGMMIKLDLSKYYNRLSWDYLNNVLKSFGFDQRWINWISSMVSSHVFSIILNGSPSHTFNPSCGLFQGDSISPFIFIIVAEGLGRYLKNEAKSS